MRPVIMLTGYWPPTNEMLRRFSTNAAQNPGGWIGSNWEGRGYDIHAFFPEFPSGSFPKGIGDFEVDYADTSADWARITTAMKPRAISTFSLDGRVANRWEYEMNAVNHPNWLPDSRSGTPIPTPPDRSLPGNAPRRMTFPVPEFVKALAASNLSVVPIIDYRENGGNFLSEFISYHGLWYKNTHGDRTAVDWCIAAGHVHVGPNQVAVLRQVVAVHLRQLVGYLDKVTNGLEQQNMGFGHRGAVRLRMRGSPLNQGGVQELTARGMAPNSPMALVLSAQLRPQFFGQAPNFGVYVVLPAQTIFFAITDSLGRLRIPNIQAGGGLTKLYAQVVYPDHLIGNFVGVTNAMEVRFQ